MSILGALMGFSLLFGLPVASVSGTAAEPPATPQHTAATFGYAVTLTAYNAVPAQTDNSPLETASGAYSNPQIIAARSRDLAKELPFGTIIALDGTHADKVACGYGAVKSLIGYRVIEDTMNPRYTDRVDVLLGTKANFVRPNGHRINAANVLGVCKGVTIRIVGHVGLAHLPKTQKALAALVETRSSGLALNN